MGSESSKDVIRVHDDPARIEGDAWNALLAQQPRPTPFMRHEYLAALHRSGSAVAGTGWAPRFITIHRGSELVAATPAYLKSHSYGEYVFDWAWADAYQRHGLDYYPKLLIAVPFTPVPGTRLMAASDSLRGTLLAAARSLAVECKASSVHLLFADDSEAQAIDASGWLTRRGVQFHWTRDADQPATDFSALLASLQRDKRKKIQQERRKVAEAGITFRVFDGAAIGKEQWEFFYRCYRLTYRAHHSTPYLTADFFKAMARDMAEHWLMFVAFQQGAPIACSLIVIDRAQRAAYGRYWGCIEHVPCLHFEACYYQPLAWCIENGFERFEGGAQGEHKMARGLMPVATRSAHWLAHPEFARAVADYLEREGHGIESYVDELREHSPFKT